MGLSNRETRGGDKSKGSALEFVVEAEASLGRSTRRPLMGVVEGMVAGDRQETSDVVTVGSSTEVRKASWKDRTSHARRGADDCRNVLKIVRSGGIRVRAVHRLAVAVCSAFVDVEVPIFIEVD